tara:strand:+ start:440 stop:1996 length:1557 start_codon:yes stop_codon:yes gene_type:complete
MQEFYKIKNKNIFRIFLFLLLTYLVSILMLFVFNPNLQIHEKIFIFAIYFGLFAVFLKNKNIGFYALAVVIPFNLFVGMIFPFVSKFNLFPLDLIITILLIVWTIEILTKDTYRFKRTKIDLLLTLLLFISIVSLIPYVIDIINELGKGSVQLTLYLIFKKASSSNILFSANMLFRSIGFILFYFYIINNVDLAKIKRFFLILLSSFSVIAVMSIVAFAISFSQPVKIGLDEGEPHSKILVDSEYFNQRSSFPFPHPNTLAGFSLLSIPLVFVLFAFSRKWKMSLLWLLILVIFLVGFSFTQTRGAVLGLDISIFIVFLLFLWKLGQKNVIRKTAFVLVMLVILSILVLNLRGFVDLYGSEEYSLEDKYRETFRLTERHEGRGNTIWPISLNMIKNNFLLGVGLGTYTKQYGNYLPSTREITHTNEIHAHNFYLHSFAELGVIGFMSYVIIFYIILKTSLLYIAKRKELRDWDYYIVFSIFIGITALLIHSFFDNLLFWREIAALFWIQVGFLFVIKK